MAERHVSGVGPLVGDPYWGRDVVCHTARRDQQHRVPKVEAASSSLVPRSIFSPRCRTLLIVR